MTPEALRKWSFYDVYLVLSMEIAEYINKVNEKLQSADNREEAFKQMFGM